MGSECTLLPRIRLPFMQKALFRALFICVEGSIYVFNRYFNAFTKQQHFCLEEDLGIIFALFQIITQ